jgi:hypothetical protein
MGLEEWKDVVGYEEYLMISNHGNVYRKERSWIGGNRGSKRVIKSGIMRRRMQHGYWLIDLEVNGKKNILKVHRLVAMAFIPNPENKPQVNHKDLNRSNSCVSNLEWVTAKENIIHARMNKKDWKKRTIYTVGEKISTSKLNETKVREIRNSPLINKDIAVIYNIDRSTISRIRNRQYWKHVI